MLLWKTTFSSDTDPSNNLSSNPNEPWKEWPRPPGGFLDLGYAFSAVTWANYFFTFFFRCGNGLLTHILTTEGYEGYGIDLRARVSWSHYPESTQAQLHIHALDPTTDDDVANTSDSYFKPGVFVIGNHADELTPWVPVLSTLHNASGYLSIPCCSWAFDAKFERSSTPMYPVPDAADFASTLNLGGDGSHSSSYSMYRIWLGSLSLHCGWEVESETLRIPSTRNWAIIGVSTPADRMINLFDYSTFCNQAGDVYRPSPKHKH